MNIGFKETMTIEFQSDRNKLSESYIIEDHNKIGSSLPINTLLILNELKRSRRLTLAELSKAFTSANQRLKLQ